MYESSLGRYRDDDCKREEERAVIGENALNDKLIMAAAAASNTNICLKRNTGGDGNRTEALS